MKNYKLLFINKLSFYFLATIGLLLTGSAQILAQGVKFVNIDGANVNASATKILGLDKSGVSIYHANNKGRNIDFYNLNLNKIASRAIPYDDKPIQMVDIIATSSGSHVFFSIYKFADKKHGLFHLHMPPTGPTDQLQPATVFDLQNITSERRSNFAILSAPDASAFVALNTFSREELGLQLEIAFLDTGFKTRGNSSLILGHKDLKAELKQSHYDVNGNLFLLFKMVNEKQKFRAANKITHKLAIINKDKPTFYIDFEDTAKHIPSLAFVLDRFKNEIKVSGLYKGVYDGPALGYVFYGIPLDSLHFKQNYANTFSPEIKMKLQSFKSSSREKDQSDYEIKHLIPRSDGGAVLIAEMAYTQTQTFVQYSQGFPVTREIRYFHNDEIVTISINADGSMDWYYVLPKAQQSVNNSDYNSFALVRLPDKLVFLFNEESRSSSAITQFNISNKGEASPRIFISQDLSGMSIIPKDARQVSPQSLLVPAVRKKRLGLLKITF